MVAVGLALFVLPDATRPLWPWTLTTLTARAIGAWFLGIGVIAFHAFRENDLVRIRPVGGGLTFFGILQLVALARYSDQMMWGTVAAWLYLLFLASLLPAGLYAWFAPDWLRKRRAHRETPQAE